jgi:mono/diheme cytochrome c family protein
MKNGRTGSLAFLLILIAGVILIAGGPPQVTRHDYVKFPPFRLDGLKKQPVPAGGAVLYGPKNPYNIFINYELGMHCVGFDVSYCCIIPPYNSIQAQVIRSAGAAEGPEFLTDEDKVKLHYSVRDNSYSEGNKMKYWQVLKDANGNGRLDDPNDNMANYVWTNLFIYKDLKGTLPPDWQKEKRLHVGREIPVGVDSGPSGKPLSGGDLDYAGPKGGNVVFTDSLVPQVKNIPLTLTASHLWDALGLPLTAFYDSRRQGTIRTISDDSFQPFQYATVQLRNEAGEPVLADGKAVEFFGTNPVDLPNCFLCHSGEGVAAKAARQDGLTLFDKEYKYWKTNYPDITDFMARLSQGSICVLEFHDKNHGTGFLRDFRADASSNRLGEVGSVYCADCHGDNVSGNLQTPRPGLSGYKPVQAEPLSEAVHRLHAEEVPFPDKAGRTQSCQACHPGHWQEAAMNVPGNNPYAMLDGNGNPRFSESDQRLAGGGCYLRRDATSNPGATPPYFFNDIGRWYYENVSLRDESGRSVAEMRGLMCTNCHNELAQALSRYDDLKDVVAQTGRTLKNKPLEEVIKALAAGDRQKFADFYADPKVRAAGEPLIAYYGKHESPVLAKSVTDPQGNLSLLPWNSAEGSPVPYKAASGGNDWWLAAAEPHCANCHAAPFVESEGGAYFPIDQPNKYALYRFSKAHGDIACQSCHESIHGLYPVRYEGAGKTVDLTTHDQALQFSPDGTYAGPVTCAACHVVNEKGIPRELRDTEYFGDYWASVVLLHFMRGEDVDLPIAQLVKKFPYKDSRAIVLKSWM